MAVAAPILYIRRENEIKIRLAERYHMGSDYIASTAEGGISRVYDTYALLRNWAEENAKQLRIPAVE